jgi:hypothetical protein
VASQGTGGKPKKGVKSGEVEAEAEAVLNLNVGMSRVLGVGKGGAGSEEDEGGEEGAVAANPWLVTVAKKVETIKGQKVTSWWSQMHFYPKKTHSKKNHGGRNVPKKKIVFPCIVKILIRYRRSWWSQCAYTPTFPTFKQNMVFPR